MLSQYNLNYASVMCFALMHCSAVFDCVGCDRRSCCSLKRKTTVWMNIADVKKKVKSLITVKMQVSYAHLDCYSIHAMYIFEWCYDVVSAVVLPIKICSECKR